MKRMMSRLRRSVSVILTAALITPAIMLPVHAETTDIYIPETEIEEGILQNDVFYLTAANAQLKEGANERYILRLARGGDCASDSAATVKIADLSAKYGRDYTISVLDSDAEVVNPDGNESLIERMEGEEYTETELKSEDEYAEMLEDDEEMKQATQKGLQDAIDYLEDASGLLSAQSSDKDGAVPAEDAETVSTNPLQQARAMYTGIEGEPQKVTSTTDTLQQIQQMANVMTNAVVGATLKVDFAAGESEKYIAIDVKDNNDGDGYRYFFLMLGAPEGTTTNSAASSCSLTIVDDEEQEPSKVSFTESEYSAADSSVTVEIERSGALNTIAAAHLTAESGTAQAGRDFSPIDMDVVFPMGIDKRRIEIPVRQEYIAGSADFKLKLETSEMCEIDGGEAAVTIDGTLGIVDDDSDISLSAIQESNRVSDIVLADNALDLSKPAKTGSTDHSTSQNYYDSKNKYYRLMWEDDSNGWERFWGYNMYTGYTGASWTLDPKYRGADIAGVQLNWKRNGNCAEIIVGFLGSYSGDARWDAYDNKLSYQSMENFGGNNYVKKNIFCNYWDPKRVTILNHGRCEDCNNMYIESITPILRPFVINLNNADSLEFLNADGSKSVFGDATYLALADAVNTNNRQIIRYTKKDKNNIGLMQTLGGNNKTPYTYLKSVSIIKDGKTKKIATYGDDGKSTHELNMTSEWIYNNEDYISFETNNSSHDWENQTGTFGMRGRIELKPEFGYRDAKVRVTVPTENFGHLKLSGEEKNINKTTDYSYHRGDIIKISTVMDSKYNDAYKATGVRIRYKINESDAKWQRDEILQYDKNGEAYLDPSSDHRLQYGYYEITPVFQRKDNVLTLRVKKSDLSKFDTSYGYLASPNRTEVTIDNTDYYEYVLEPNPVYGEIYPVSVRMAADAGGNVYPIWSDVQNPDRVYGGEVFFHEARNIKDYNVITLSYETESGENIYQSVNGSVFTPAYNMSSRGVDYTSSNPATGAVVNFGGQFAVVDKDGSFKVPPFRAMNNTSGSSKRHYIKYMISLNEQDKLGEMELVNAAPHDEDVLFVNNDTNNTETRTVSVCAQNLGQQLINTENGSIISNISLSVESADGDKGYDQGGIIVTKGDTVTVKAAINGSVTYTKVEKDDSGKLIKTPDTPENISGIKFIIYDPTNHQEIDTFDATKNEDSTFSAEIKLDNALPGYNLYMKVTTDRSHGITGEAAKTTDEAAVDTSSAENDKDAVAEREKAMNTTTYTDVFTGYTFLANSSDEVPVIQHLDSPVNMDLDSLPLLGSTSMRFDLPFVSVGSIKTATGYRMYVGFSPMQIVDTASNMHATKFASGTGAYFQDLFTIKHPIQSFKNGLAASYNEAFKNVPANNLTSAASLGGPTWRMDVQVGFYLDFTYAGIVNPNIGKTDNVAVLTGAGAYVGVSAGFRMTWYTILPVVFIPAYFGIDIDGNVLGFMGAQSDMSKPKVSYDDAKNASIEFENYLGEFHGSVQMAVSVAVYVGVGLAGTFGLRGGGTFTAMGMWYPSPYVSDFGADLVFTAGIWIDLFLFSIPLQYTFPDIKFGSFKEYASMDPLQPEVTDKNKASAASLSSVEDEQPRFSVRQPYSNKKSEWLPEGDISLMSAFGEETTQTIVDNAYEHPDTQLLKLDDGSVFMAFLDSDTSRADTERTVLKYSVYKDGEWSDPNVVQDDGTADYQPSVCLAGDGKVMISWLSRDASNGTTSDSADYLKGMEVYTTDIDVASGSISEITRLTNDDYYDYTPTSVYDEVTGDKMVYYVKTFSSGTAEEMVNSYTNDCVVVYMLYSKEKNKWMFDEYYDNEVASEEDKETLLNEWRGQRFLASPLPELGFNVPNISDFSATAYNGIAVYAYTIDQDSSNDTTYDKELFMQCYDFKTHMTYVPIRLTNDSISDALPQFVRTEGKIPEDLPEGATITKAETADTKLFWYRDEKDIVYIDISSLVRDGVDENGHIKEDYFKTGKGDEVKGIDSLYAYVSVPAENQSASRYMADFKPIVNGDDLYIVWTQPTRTNKTDEDGNIIQCREVYATALVQDETAKEPEEDTGNNNEEGSEENNLSTGGAGCSWAPPYRLTNTNAFTDEPNAVIDSNGNLMVLYNSFNQELTGDENNPVEITDFNLKATYMEPCGAVDVTDISPLNETPLPNETVSVSADVTNNGLTLADGYDVKIYAAKNGVKQGNPIFTEESDNKLLPGNTDTYMFEWTVPADGADGISFIAEAREHDMPNVSDYESEKLEEKPIYTVDDVNSYQDGNGYHVDYSITNTGNAPSKAGDTMDVIFSGPYAIETDLTPEERDWGSAEVGDINVGETKSYTVDLTVMPEKFDDFGFVDCLLIGKDKEGHYNTDGESIRLLSSMPTTLLLNGEPFPENIKITKGSTMEFNITCEPSRLNERLGAALGTDDASVAAFDGTTLKAISEGTTVIHGNVTPYGNAIPDITVTVTPKTSSRGHSSGGSSGAKATPSPTAAPETTPAPETTVTPTGGYNARFKDVAETDWFCDSVNYAAEKGYFAGVSEDTFEPDTNVTRGMLITVIGRMEGIEPESGDTTYTDVDKGMYYAPYIAWGTENGIVAGYGDGTFGPDDLVTREQTAAMLWRYAKYRGADMSVGEDTNILSYTDADKISEYAIPAIQWACGAGIMSGYTDNTLRPQNNATRAETAALTERFDKIIK